MKKWEEFKFKIEAYTPDTLPLSRLADYLGELAVVLGESAHVHFARLEPGSTIMVNRVETEAVPKVRERAAAVRSGKGTVHEMKAFRRINTMLKEDNGTGAVITKGGAEIIRFIGKEEEKGLVTSVSQYGEIDGEVIRIGGKKQLVPVHLDTEGHEISGCFARRYIAKDLARNLYEPVRLFGKGDWERSEEGEWILNRFIIDRFEVLKTNPLSQVVMALRSIQGNWGDNTIEEMLNDRNSGEAH